MGNFGVTICVPMDFREDDAIKVLNRAINKLICEGDIAREVNISRNEYNPDPTLRFSYNVHFVVFKTMRNRIHMDTTINFEKAREFYDCYVDLINKVSENLYYHMQDCIKMQIKSFKIAENSVYGLTPRERKYVVDDMDAVKKVADTWKYEYRPYTPRLNYIKPVKVIFNNPATIVLWSDGTKTVVKRQKGDRYNKETGLAMCYVKKFCGDNTSRGLNDILKLANEKEEK